MSKIKELAARAADVLVDEHEVPGEQALSAGMISLFVEILQVLVKAFQSCGTSPTEAAEAARRPGLAGRLRLRAEVQRAVSKGARRRLRLDRYQSEVRDALLTVGRDVSDKDLSQALDEV